MRRLAFLKRHKRKILLSRSFLLILALSLCINLSGCTLFSNVKNFITEKFTSEDEMNEVIEVVNTFFSLLIDKEYEKAYEYLSSKDKSRGNLDNFYEEFKNVTDIVSINIDWVEIKDDLAVVGMDLTDSYDGEEKVFKDIEVSLVREEDESWKVVFWN